MEANSKIDKTKAAFGWLSFDLKAVFIKENL